jgi:hypothetical protein
LLGRGITLTAAISHTEAIVDVDINIDIDIDIDIDMDMVVPVQFWTQTTHTVWTRCSIKSPNM